ncbi:MAG: hypothetical protein ABI675_13135 [Chitinophagaceae bacterium]
MLVKILWLSGSGIFLVLGTLHLYYTFFTGKFNARNKTVTTEMKNTSPVLTGETTMWNAWIGFNASHSAGAIFFGLINILLAAQYFPVIQNSVLVILLNITTVVFYCWLAKKYWFRVPFTGILLATGCFVASSIIICLG